MGEEDTTLNTGLHGYGKKTCNPVFKVFIWPLYDVLSVLLF